MGPANQQRAWSSRWLSTVVRGKGVRMKTILIIQDDPGVGDMLTQALELAGYHSLLAGAGLPVDARCADMVLCDMPRLAAESTSFVRAMRTSSGLQKMPCVVVSSYYGYVASEESSAVTLKPFELQTVLESVHTSIGQP